MVDTSWILAGNTNPGEISFSTFSAKQKMLKRDLKTLSRENYSDIQNSVRETNLLLQSVQIKAITNLTPALYQQERELHQKWDMLRKVEEAYFKQRSHINWLREGDLNTAYFHRITQLRNAFNAIQSFSTPFGVLVDDPSEMSRMAVNHFFSILGPGVLPPLTVTPSCIQSLISYRCPSVLKASMIRIPSHKEITRVLFKLNANKASGPDGFTSAFYKAAWGILGSEVTASILKFFHTSFLPLSVNATTLALIPKVPGASVVSDFRPISCLNTLYKVIAKLLVARLKPVLPELIQRNQSAFIKGRLLVENTLLAAELVNGYHKEKGPKRITIKVDIAKAFDTIRWEYIFSCLRGIEIPKLYLWWLQACICLFHCRFQRSGVPLCTKKLTLLDCAPLIQKVKSKFNAWSTKSLSFVGRLQLLNTVIAGLTNFWCSAFVLPKKCIQTLNSLSGAFLWKGTTEGHHSACVAWETITTAKSEGGLGIRDLQLWNKACMIKLIWLLLFRSGSVWVAWFKGAVLSGKLSNFWTRKPSTRYSWLANKLFKLRDEVYPWIKLKVGDGKNCQFWSDNWWKLGKLSTYLQGEDPLGIPRGSTLADLWREGTWRIPPARSEAHVNYHIELASIQLSKDADQYVWWLNDQLQDSHETGKICLAYKGNLPRVSWHKVVWFSRGILKHCFLTWLFVLNRSPTRDRLRSWGLHVDPACLFCATGEESRDHLFFDCPFSWTLWNLISNRCSPSPTRSWTGSLQNLINYQGPREAKILLLTA
ncbi:PREDICTED: uncharacterized protein LOC109128016 [Camelina sativa]|uniref:Uncharacterized protein LOC109128016 n=1 Tax=Camelina sativa TaxID=90675 RepID=A0ABM1QR32_CAMSA|nr:PREDICTED: uncharacterized protein LOC109128016 [Camelina sativa]